MESLSLRILLDAIRVAKFYAQRTKSTKRTRSLLKKLVLRVYIDRAVKRSKRARAAKLTRRLVRGATVAYIERRERDTERPK